MSGNISEYRTNKYTPLSPTLPPTYSPTYPPVPHYLADKEGIGSVIMFSVHHAIGDGMSLVAVSRRVAESLGGGEVGQVGAGVGAALDAASRTRRNLGSWMKFSFAEVSKERIEYERKKR